MTYNTKLQGWSVVRSFENSNVPAQQHGQGLTRDEAVSLARMIFERDPVTVVEALDETGTTRAYWSTNRPQGFFGG